MGDSKKKSWSWFRKSESSSPEKKKKQTLDTIAGWEKVQPQDITIGVFAYGRAGATSLCRALSDMGPATSDSPRFRVEASDSKTTVKAEMTELPSERKDGLKLWLIDLCDLTDKEVLEKLTYIVYIVSTGYTHPTSTSAQTALDLFTTYREKIFFVHTKTDEKETQFARFSSEKQENWRRNYWKQFGDCPIDQKFYWTSAVNFGIDDGESTVNQDVNDLRRTLLNLGNSVDRTPPITLTDTLVAGTTGVATLGATFGLVELLDPQFVQQVEHVGKVVATAAGPVLDVIFH
jgi:hypothetical protein